MPNRKPKRRHPADPVRITRRWHENGWIATVLEHPDGTIEGCLWDEGCAPFGRHVGRPDSRVVQRTLDETAVHHGHECSERCGTWSDVA